MSQHKLLSSQLKKTGLTFKYRSKKLFLFFYFAATIFSAKAQSSVLSGFVIDKKTGEALVGASVLDVKSKAYAVCNSYGFFSLSLPSNDSVDIRASYIGYSLEDTSIFMNKNIQITLKLISGFTLNEVTVSSEKRIEQKTEISVIELHADQIKSIPAIGGESDVMKVLQLMPGVQSGSEGSSGLYVRGGSPDQNLIIMDDVPLYNVNHLGGFVSIFNSDALLSVKLIKGGFPARYGGRLSSVLDIRMKEGNNQNYVVQGGIGIVSSRLSVEGPIGKKTSFIVSGRRFLLDLLSRPISKLAFNGVALGYYFYDSNIKINHRISEKDRIFFSFYQGNDKILVKVQHKNQGQQNDKFSSKITWGNMLYALRWNHVFNPKLFCNISATYTRYHYLTNVLLLNNTEGKEINSGFLSQLHDMSPKIDFDYYPLNSTKIKFGGQYIYHEFLPGSRNFLNREGGKILLDTSYGNKLYANEFSSYLEAESELTKLVSVNAGMRFSNYLVQSKNYSSLEPRISANYLLSEYSSVKASFSKTKQFVHLLSFSGTGMPTDLWVPSTKNVPPSTANQYAIGYARTCKNLYEISIESYYKQMYDLIDYQEGATFYNTSSDWEKKVETAGKGQSYGLEILLKKTKGKSTGWISYTLSKSTRKFENINNANSYPYRYDRRHDFSITYIYKIKESIDFSAVWIFGTGNPITLAVAKYNAVDDLFPNESALFGFDYNQTAFLYNGKNNYRMRSFHKLDIGINFRKEKKWGERTWSFSIYNVYNRQNPLYYYYDTPSNKPSSNLRLYQQSLFPIIPSVSYNFRFQKKTRSET
jgi:TonB-dependent Receptor Plug Domain/CarboxypepD_reg-like domain